MIQEKKLAGKPFTFKNFKIDQDRCAMKVGTDGVLLGAWADVANAHSILDIGTGTGIIAIMLAQRIVSFNDKSGVDMAVNSAKVHAVEIDEASFYQAKENFTLSPYATYLEPFHDSIQNYAKSSTHKYDLIVSNPPFFTGGTFSSNQDKTNVRHTVKLPHGDLLNATRQLLNKNGLFCVILPLIEGLRFIEIARTYGFHNTKRTEVRTREEKGIERLLLQFETHIKPLMHDELVIQNSDERNDYTDDYKNLTRDFYTIF